jgi:sterol desaturase/sphingolipid hydroxylase (fatty acid hydroxylase superfamily)
MVIFVILLTILFTFLVGSFCAHITHVAMHIKEFKFLNKFHNVHHELYTVEDFESDKYRDAGIHDSSWIFIPVVCLGLIIQALVLWVLFSTWIILPIMAIVGSVVGYVNTYVHRAFHLNNHFLNRFLFFKELKRIHIFHHLKENKNYGIVWFGFDKLFNTFVD